MFQHRILWFILRCGLANEREKRDGDDGDPNTHKRLPMRCDLTAQIARRQPQIDNVLLATRKHS